MIRICPKCGRFFEAYPSNNRIYCGVNCARNHRLSLKKRGYSNGGRRPDLKNLFFRSSYEANYARWLNLLINNGEIKTWDFEPETFEFKSIKKGVRFYTPDFRIIFGDTHTEYHEVKGWDYPKGITARKRFAKYYPQFKLVLIDKEWFKAAKKQGLDKLLPEWE